MTNQTSPPAKANQGHAHGVIPFVLDGFPFITGSAIAAMGAYYMGWTTATFILTVLFLFMLNFFHVFEQISYLIAQRIIAYVSVGDKVQVGQRVGGNMILARQKFAA